MLSRSALPISAPVILRLVVALIGLVAGAIVAVVYWGVAIVARVLS